MLLQHPGTGPAIQERVVILRVIWVVHVLARSGQNREAAAAVRCALDHRGRGLVRFVHIKPHGVTELFELGPQLSREEHRVGTPARV